MKEERTFKKEKETKNTVRFTEEAPSDQTQLGSGVIIGTLYVQKWFAGEATELTITIETNR